MPEPLMPKTGFWHEGCDQPIAWSAMAFNRVFQGDHVIGRAQCVGKTEIDLVLPECDLVMAHFHFQTHLSRASINSVRTCTASSSGGEIKITAHIMRDRVGTLPVLSEEEELRFGADISMSTLSLSVQPSLRFNMPRGSPSNGLPSGVIISQKKRARRISVGDHGRTA